MPDTLPFASLITRFAMASEARVDPTDKIFPPRYLHDNGWIFGYTLVPSSPPAPKPIPPQLNQPPALKHGGNVLADSTHSGIIPPSSKQPSAVNPAPAPKPNPPQLNVTEPSAVRREITPLTNDVAKRRSDVHAVSTHPAIIASSAQPSTESVEAEEENNDNLIPNSPAYINMSTSTCELHPKKKAKQDPFRYAIVEQLAQSLQNYFASQMKVKLSGEEVLIVVSKVPNLSRLQVFKAVRILLSGNPQEFSLMKSLPDVEKTEWILFLINESQVNVVPVLASTLKPSPPQLKLNQPPAVRNGMALPTKDIAKRGGDVHAMSTPSAIPRSSKQPSPG